jgi:hypothetical protein
VIYLSAGTTPGLTVLLIAAPTDGAVFDYFRALAARWSNEITADRLLIEGGIPLRPGLAAGEIPKPIQKLISADVQIFSSLEIEFAGLKVAYLRSGGTGPTPFRQSFYDELHVTLEPNGNELIAQAAVKAACTMFDVEAIRSNADAREFSLDAAEANQNSATSASQRD